MVKKTKSTEVVKKEPTEVAWNQEQISLIKETVAKGATDNELKLFLYTAQRSGLDPLTKQIHFVKRWDAKLQKEVGAIQTGIDGYRAIAERTGQMAGSDDPIFEEGSINVFKDGKPITVKGPEKATVSVYRIVKNMRVPFTASARWIEYAPRNPKQAFMWDKMPYLMLGKVAEALALRKAFPLNLSGIYTFEEMHQAEPIVDIKPNLPPTTKANEEVVPTINLDTEVPTEADFTAIKASITKHLTELALVDVTRENVHEMAESYTGLKLEPENYEEINQRLEILIDERTK